MRKTFRQIFRAGMAAILVTVGGPVSAAESPVAAPPIQLTDTQDVLRAYLRVQEELHAVRLAMESNRTDSEDIAARNVQALGERLNAIEQSIGSQRATELQALQSSNHIMLIVTGVLALLGFGIVAFAYLQWRTMHRFTEAALGFQMQQQLGGGRMASILDTSGPRLLGIIDRLEKRIHELEHMNRLPLPPVEAVPNTDGTDGKGISDIGLYPGTDGEGVATPKNSGQTDHVTLLLNKGQSLLTTGQTEAALACYDEILASEPANTEALVKKGAALEKLQKLNEAIACYDLAIEADKSVTIAYLYKGGVFNRMERYNEALECYEKALKTQEKPQAA